MTRNNNVIRLVLKIEESHNDKFVTLTPPLRSQLCKFMSQFIGRKYSVFLSFHCIMVIAKNCYWLAKKILKS